MKTRTKNNLLGILCFSLFVVGSMPIMGYGLYVVVQNAQTYKTFIDFLLSQGFGVMSIGFLMMLLSLTLDKAFFIEENKKHVFEG